MAALTSFPCDENSDIQPQSGVMCLSWSEVPGGAMSGVRLPLQRICGEGGWGPCPGVPPPTQNNLPPFYCTDGTLLCAFKTSMVGHLPSPSLQNKLTHLVLRFLGSDPLGTELGTLQTHDSADPQPLHGRIHTDARSVSQQKHALRLSDALQSPMTRAGPQCKTHPA